MWGSVRQGEKDSAAKSASGREANIGRKFSEASPSLSMSHNSDRNPFYAKSPVREIAALCVAGRSIYKHLPGVVAFDKRRDARTFSGGCPVVAHPPCKLWGATRFIARSKDPDAEKALGVWCVAQVIENGGIVEQPMRSTLWDACGLPRVGDMSDPFLWTLYVEQSWFGYPARKPTWLLLSGIPQSAVRLPLRLSDDARNVLELHDSLRSQTTERFGKWLVALARETWKSLPGKFPAK